MTIVFEITTDRLRQLLSKSATAQATTVQASAFLALYGEQIKNELNTRLVEFVNHKISAR